MKNIKELRTELASLFGDVRHKKVEPKFAKELNNTAGKIMQSAMLELKYAEQRKEKPEIAFLGA